MLEAVDEAQVLELAVEEVAPYLGQPTSEGEGGPDAVAAPHQQLSPPAQPLHRRPPLVPAVLRRSQAGAVGFISSHLHQSMIE